MAVDDIYRVNISATDGSSIVQNVYTLRTKTALDVTSAMLGAFATDAVTLFLAAQSNTITYTGWDALQLWGPNMSIVAGECRREGGLQFADVLSSTGGTSATEALPPQAAMVITWTTGFAGRRKRGRTYAFGQVEGSQSAGVWSSAALTAQNTRLTTFLNLYKAVSGTNPNFTIGVWSERTASGCIPATPPAKGHVQIETPHPELAFTGITGATLRSTVFNQRRRTRGVGR